MALLDLNVNVVSRLGLEPVKTTNGGYLFNGIVPAIVTSVSVDFQKHEKGEFAGLEVPVLKIELADRKIVGDEADRFLTYTLKVVGSKQLVKGSEDQYEDREVKDIQADNNTLWGTIKHFLVDGLNNSPSYRDITKISKEDLMKYFDLPDHGSANNRLSAYNAFFNYIADFVNGDGNVNKSMILDKDSKPYQIWVKLLPNFDKDPKRNAKYYAISRFIGAGVFEPLKVNGATIIPPRILRVKPTESLELTKVVTTPIPGTTPGTPAGNVQASSNLSPEVQALLNAQG